MTNKVVALLGLSGIGKSTTLENLSSKITFQHLQASTIIKARRAKLESEALSNDDLRNLSIDENQQLLIDGFKDTLQPSPALVILDGHSAIETPTGIILIEPEVFAAIGIEHLIFLSDDSRAIAQRRDNDQLRKRPAASEIQLRAFQDIALAQAAAIARELDITMTVLKPSHTQGLAKLLTEVR